MLRGKLGNDDFKYGSLNDFMGVKVYADSFVRVPNLEKEKLWQTANWIHIFFKMVPAIRNKGLTILVVSKLVEGWHGTASISNIFTPISFSILSTFSLVKYVTGECSKPETENRELIYDTEGKNENLTNEDSVSSSRESKVVTDKRAIKIKNFHDPVFAILHFFLCELQEATTAYPCHTSSSLPSLLHPPCTESVNNLNPTAISSTMFFEPEEARCDDKIFHDHSQDPREQSV
jgi:hypothetical protein